jgi:hypothetical protein
MGGLVSMDKVAFYKDHIYKQADLLSHKDIVTHHPANKNITLITGYSGSGKTTIGEQFEKKSPNNVLIELDGFQFGYDTTGDENIINSFIKKHGKINSSNFDDKMPLIWKHIEDHAALHPDKHYYVDGIQSLSDPELFNKYPSIIKGTGFLKSSYRKYRRERDDFKNPIKGITHAFRYNSNLSKQLKNSIQTVRER